MPRHLHCSQQKAVSHCSSSAGTDPQLYPAHHQVSGWDHNWCQGSSTKSKDMWLTATQTKCLMHGFTTTVSFPVSQSQFSCPHSATTTLQSMATPPHNQLKVGAPLPGIQVEYFEQFMRSFHEDLWYAPPSPSSPLSLFLPYPLFLSYPLLSLTLLSSLLSFFSSFHSRYDIHRDFWGLAVDMFRQFFITQVSTW